MVWRLALPCLVLVGCVPQAGPEASAPSPSGRAPVRGPMAGFSPVPKTSATDHVPAAPEFDRIVRSDLERALLRGDTNNERLDYELLSRTPVKSGSEFPRFFAWVSVTQEGYGVTKVGVVTLAAMHKSGFNVGEIVAKKDLAKDLAGYSEEYPADVLEAIKKKLQ